LGNLKLQNGTLGYTFTISNPAIQQKAENSKSQQNRILSKSIERDHKEHSEILKALKNLKAPNQKILQMPLIPGWHSCVE